MFDPAIESLVVRVRENAECKTLPINLEKIADYEGILLEPLSEHKGFNGKIEFLPDENLFVVFHPDPATYPYPKRLRFTIAHELGHYYIDSHRAALIAGQTHNSLPNFRSKDPKEVQADEFAAALLIPAQVIETLIKKRGFLTLEQINRIAGDCEASIYATAIRYVKMTGEACVVCLAHQGSISSSFASDEAITMGFGRLRLQTVPPASPARLLAGTPRSAEFREASHDVSSWYPTREDLTVWESSMSLGEGYTLSLLSWESEGDDE